MEKLHILSIDDDPKIGDLLRQYMEEDGHSVHILTEGRLVLPFLASHQVDVILLDIILPDTDGLTLMRDLRAQTDVPIIVVSGKDDTMDKIIGLELGADDYVTKPFHLREIAARIKTVIRRNRDDAGASAAKTDHAHVQPDIAQKVTNGASVRFEGWTLDNARHELRDPQGGAVALTTGEFMLLQILVQSPHRVLSRDYLFEQTRDADFEAYDRAVDIQITRLRKKMDDNPREPRFIKTIRGVGYMFIAKVEPVDE